MRRMEENNKWVLSEYIKLQQTMGEGEAKLEEKEPYAYQADLRINDIDSRYSVVAHLTVESEKEEVSEEEVKQLAMLELKGLLEEELTNGK